MHSTFSATPAYYTTHTNPTVPACFAAPAMSKTPACFAAPATPMVPVYYTPPNHQMIAYSGPIWVNYIDPITRQATWGAAFFLNQSAHECLAREAGLEQLRYREQQTREEIRKYEEARKKKEQEDFEKALNEHRKMQKAQDEAEMDSYLKEIHEKYQKQVSETTDGVEQATETYKLFSSEPVEKSRNRRKNNGRDRRKSSRTNKAGKSIIADSVEPLAEVPRSENYNANKPRYNDQFISSDKRKGQKFQARRKFGSGWAKQLDSVW